MIITELLESVRSRARDRCEYCLLPQLAHVLTFPIDHVIARQHGGETIESNLALSCVRCNSYKGPNIAGLDPASGELTRLFHLRSDLWIDRFLLRGSRIDGRSAIGRTTVFVLNMNHADSIALRESLIIEGVFNVDF